MAGLPPVNNPLRLKTLHHVEMVVGNAKQSAFFYRKAFGFSQLAYRGLETGDREVTSYVMAQNNIRLVLSTPLTSQHPYNDFLRRHGDAVIDIAMEVEDVQQAHQKALKAGALESDRYLNGAPQQLKDQYGTVRRAAICTYGDTVHSFIEKGDYSGVFLPGYEEQRVAEPDCGLLSIDHVVGNVELGAMQRWAEFYEGVMGFHRYITFDDKDISTEYSALMSMVMSSDNYAIKFPINEPAQGKKKSQIAEYLDFSEGAGVQHLALLTQDIVRTVQQLRERGVAFLAVPDSYYGELLQRVGPIDEQLKDIQGLGILVDRDDEGYLLQLFTQPVEDRPTLFFEIIQRHGARGFGKGNFRALFESIEREQAKRGNL